MAKYSTNIDYNITTKLDASGITQLQTQLKAVENEFNSLASKQLISPQQVNSATQQIRKLQQSLLDSFNPTTGMLNIDTFFKSLGSGKNATSLNQLATTFNKVGATGQAAFNNMLTTVGKLDTRLQTTSKSVNKIFTTLGNTVRWGLIASAFQTVMNSAHEAVKYMQDLDKSLTDIQMVGHSSAEDMRQLALEANEAAKALGSTTVAYTDATKIFVQQGLSLEDSQQFAEMSLKLSNVAGESADEAAEQITALKNGFQMAGDTVESSLDKIVKTSHITASSVEELATAATRVAATANTLGVTDDQLYSQLSTIIQVTREAPEIVGNSLKTIYARFADLKLGETLEDGMNLGQFSGTLEKLGVSVLDSNGQLREMGSIIEDLMAKWDTFDRATKQGAAVTLAGKFQYNRLMTLMENADAYRETLNSLQNDSDVDGLLANKNDEVYLQSLEGKANQLKATFEGLMSDLFDQDNAGPVLDTITKIVDGIDKLVNSIGGGMPVLTAFGALLTKTFSTSIARSINQIITDTSGNKIRQENANILAKDLQGQFSEGTLTASQQNLVNAISDFQSKIGIMNDDQLAKANELLGGMKDKINEAALAEEEYQGKLRITQEILRLNNDELAKDAQLEEKLNTRTQAELRLNTNAREKDNPGVEVDLVKQDVEFAATGYERLSAALNEIPGPSEKAAEGIKEIKQGFEGLTSSAKYDETILKDVVNIIQSIEETMERGDTTLEDYAADMDALAIYMEKVVTTGKAVEEEVGFISGAEAEIARNKMESAQSQQGVAEDATNDELSNLNKQIDISNIVNAVAAVGQLSFAWQSFQSLGSLWANEDTAAGEKVVQTIMNLGFTLPMAIDGLRKLNDIKLNNKLSSTLLTSAETKLAQSKELSVKADQQRALASKLTQQGLTKEATFANAAALAYDKQAAAAQRSAKATSGIGKAIGALGGPLGIAMIGITAITTALSYFDEQAKQQYEDAKERAEAAKTRYDEAEQAKQSFDSVYENYKEGSASIEELKASAKSLKSVFGENLDTTALLTDNYQQLAQAVKDASDAERDAAIRENDNFLATTKESIRGSWNNQDAWTDIKNAFDASYNMEMTSDGYAMLQTTSFGAQFDKLKAEDNIYGAIKLAEQQIKEWQKAQNEIKKAQAELNPNDDDYKKLENQYTSYANQIKKVQDVLALEDISDYKNYLEENAKLLADAFSENIVINKDDDIKQIINDLANKGDDLGIYLSNMDSYTDQLSFLLEHTTDDISEMTLAVELANEEINSLIENFKNQSIDDNNAFLSLLDSGQADQRDHGDLSVSDTDFAQAVLDRWQEVADQLSDEQKLELSATLDENSSLQEISLAIERMAGNLPELQVIGDLDTSKLTNRFTETADTIKEALDGSDFSDKGFERFSEAMSNQEVQKVDKALQKFNDTIKDSAEFTGDAAKATEEFAAMQANAADMGEDLAARNVRLNKGVSDLIDSWKDINAVLRDASSEGTADWYNALASLDTIVSDILDLDIGTLSQQFLSSAETAEILQRAVDGDLTAIDELRTAAAEDVILHMQITGMSEDESSVLREELVGLLNDFQAICDENNPIVTPETDPTGFLSTLNELLAASAITAEEATAILSSIGMEGTLTTKQVMGQTPAVRYRIRKATTDVVGPGIEESAGEIFMEPEITMVPTPMNVPVIEGATYSGPGVSSVGGSSSHRVGSNASKGSGGSGGSGKKSSSDKKYEPKTKDPIEEEVDRYERVDTLLKDVEKRFDKVADEQDRLTGYKQAANMSEQIQLLRDQINLHKEKLEIQKQEAAELQKELKSRWGVKFDDEGFITNYAATLKALENNYNNLVAQYNSATTEAAQEALEKRIDAAKKSLEDFKNAYKRYDDLVANDMNESKKALEELEDKLEDIKIQAFKDQTEAVENLKDLQEAMIDFQGIFSGLRKDNPLRDMEASAAKLGKYFDTDKAAADKYFNSLIANTKKLAAEAKTPEEKKWREAQLQKIQEAKANSQKGGIESFGTGYFDMEMLNMEMMNQQLAEFEKTGSSSIFGKNSAELYKTAEEVFKSATDMMKEFEDEIYDLEDSILEFIDEIGDKIDERLEAYELINEELEHQQEILELLRGDRNYEEINKLLEAQQYNYDAAIKDTQTQLDILKKQQSLLTEGSKEWKAVQEIIVDTQKELNELVEESLKISRQIYENNVDKIIEDLTKKSFGTDFDWLEDQWEMINRNADYYLDDVNKAYNIQKLQSKYLDLLDNAGDLATQQKITAQMEEQLGYLRDKEKVSEYDVRWAEMQIELLQKRIALEEAQANKSQLKLRRDSQGNYNYVYTADTSQVKAAQDDLLEAQNNAYNLSKDRYREVQEDAMKAYQDAMQLIAEIRKDSNLTAAEQEERVKAVMDNLAEYLGYTAEQLGEAEKNVLYDFQGMCDILGDEITDTMRDIQAGIAEGNTEMMDQLIASWDSSIVHFLQNQEEFKSNLNSTREELISNANEYQKEVNKVAGYVKQDFGSITSAVSSAKKATDDLLASQKAFSQQLESDMGTVGKYEDVLEKYRAQLEQNKAAMEKYQQEISKMQEKLQQYELAESAKGTQITDTGTSVKTAVSSTSSTTNTTGGSGNNSKGSGYSLGELTEGIAGNIWTYGTWGNDPVRLNRMKEKFGAQKGQQVHDGVQALFNGKPAYGYDSAPSKWATDGYGYYKKFAYSSFDTGGYTGEWADGMPEAKNGKLAWLHSKELVLNETDTNYILQAVEAVRGMVQSIKGGALSGIADIFTKSAPLSFDNEQPIQQNVEIQAEFPNANSVDTIQDALLGLADRAMQYTKRTR